MLIMIKLPNQWKQLSLREDCTTKLPLDRSKKDELNSHPYNLEFIFIFLCTLYTFYSYLNTMKIPLN